MAIDADEFWWLAHGSLSALLGETRDAGGLLCGVDNFVQRRSVVRESSKSLRTMTYRANPRGTEEDARQLVEREEIGFVEIRYPAKLILRAAPDVIIGTGNHTAKNAAGPIEETEDLRVLHAPLRARSTLIRRAEFGQRIAVAYSSPNTGWHMRRTSQIAEEGRIDAEWATNSQRFGRLNRGGRSPCRRARPEARRRRSLRFCSRTSEYPGREPAIRHVELFEYFATGRPFSEFEERTH